MTDDQLDLVRGVKAIFTDVDGILTDGSIYIGAGDVELKQFTVQDGAGAALARHAGLPLALISGRESAATTERARQMQIDEVYQGYLDKLTPFKLLLDKMGLDARQVAYIGDGFIDLPVLEQVGVPISVPNALPRVQQVALKITERSGGEGVLLEVVEWILTLQGRLEEVLAALSKDMYKADWNG